jgi:hypothetical protein
MMLRLIVGRMKESNAVSFQSCYAASLLGLELWAQAKGFAGRVALDSH